MDIYEALGYLGGFILSVQVWGLLDMWLEKRGAKKAKADALIDAVFKTFKHRKKDRDQEDK
jgi:hypothetical protein